MNRKALLFCLSLLPGLALADPGLVQVYLGQVDVGEENADSVYGLQYLSGERWTRLGFIPVAGLMRTRYESHFAYLGLSRVSYFRTQGAGFSVALEFAPGVYMHGGNEDTDLAFPLQFQSAIGLQFDLQDSSRIGLHFSHLSNASLADGNPGTETLTLRYGLRL